MRRTLVAAAGIGMMLAVSACSSSDNPSMSATTLTPASSAVTAPDMSNYPKLPAVPAQASATVTCAYPAAGQPATPVNPPSADGVPAAGTAAVAMTTSQGPIGLTLDRAEAPCAVNSFVGLTTQGYFDDTPCHRLSTSGLYILQCGDPSGSGRGGPGYRYANEYPTTAFAANDPQAQQPMVYPRGTIAMANSGPGGTNGSQFFLLYQDSPLQPQYTAFGTIDAPGLATLEKIASAGDDGSMSAGGGKPNTPVQITTVTAA